MEILRAPKRITPASNVTFLLVVSTAGVAIAAIARPATVDLIDKVADVDVGKAKRIESVLKVFVSIGGTAALLLL